MEWKRATGKHRITRERYLRAVLQPLPVIPYTEQPRTSMHEFGQSWRVRQMIGFYDLIVGATALEVGAT